MYGVPLTRDAGGPYDMDAATIETWAQVDGPTDATAVFGPQAPPTVTTATTTTPGRDGYRQATVHYLNASGLAVNVAAPTTNTRGYIDTVEYDGKGRVIRTLESTNRLRALGLLDKVLLQEWGITGTSAAIAQVIDSRTYYTTDDLAVHATRGPAQRLAVANDPTDQVTGHAVTQYWYDEGRPATVVASKLTTRERSGTVALGTDVSVSSFALLDSTVTTYGYSPTDTSVAPTDPRSGWVHKQPTSVTVDAEGPAPLRASTVYDVRGRVLSSSKPGSSGADAGTALSVLYTADASASDAACRNRPEWAGQPCVTRYAGAVTGHDATRMPGQLSEKRVTQYNRFGTATVTTEAANGQTRTTTTTVDAADRVTQVQISGSAGAGATISRVRTTYSTSTGDVLSTSSLDASGAVLSSVSRQYDDLGRLVRYTDAHGGWTRTEYDRYGQPAKVTDSIGTTREYTYNLSEEPRGFVTRIQDSAAGGVWPRWGPDGQLTSMYLPGSVALGVFYDAAGVPVRRTYQRMQAPWETFWEDSVVENHRGQWVQHTSTTGTRTYGYDRMGRLTSTDDVAAVTGTCTSRRYGYDQHSNRTSVSTAVGAEVGLCPGTEGAQVTTSTYDTADRLVSTSGGNGNAWSYDAFGRTTAMPTADGSGVAATSYFVNDLVASQELPGVARSAWTLDPLMRFSRQEDSAWVDGAWASSAEQIVHYDGDGDEPAWIVEDATRPTEVTRWLEGADGQVAVQSSGTGDRVLQIVDLHGDVVGTVPTSDAGVDLTGLRYARYDEFGNPQPLTSGATSNAPPARYGWLGGAQRSADTPTGVVLMGVRLYHPGIGRFLQVDPVAGGSASAYDYCNADPVNCTDLAGTIAWGRVLGAVAMVGEIASFIPGPVGAAAAGVSAIAYAASGNKGKALEMGITAAAALVGAGAAVRAVSSAVRAGRAAKAAKVACNSFVAGTLVRLADGNAVPIESLTTGDRVLGRDPTTGEVTEEVVIAPIWSSGTKHLVRLAFDGQTETVLATANHPFWVQSSGWVDAIDLRVGDLAVGSDGQTHPVVGVDDLGGLDDTAVFNLHTSGTHTYFVAVGDDEYLVHNSACSIAMHGVPRKPGVYRIVMKDGREYVGRSLDMHSRVHRHLTSSKSAIKRTGYTANDIAAIHTRRVGTRAQQRFNEDKLIRARSQKIGARLLNGRFEMRKRS